MESVNSNFRTYIRRALESDSFKYIHITLTDSTNSSDGYASDINYAQVLVTTKDNAKKVIEVVTKGSKKKSIEDPRRLFKRETYFYGTILPEFTKFQLQNNIENIFTSIPKYYNTVSVGDTFVIVLENLKKNEYSLYDNTKPLNLDHIKLVLEEYGKFHAISFAFRSKNIINFERLVSDYEDVLLPAITDFLSTTFQQRFEVTCDTLRKINQPKLYETCHRILKRGVGNAMIELLKTVESKSAILHGDCWNNNFMFKYESEDHTSPSKVAILDWQLSRLHSPILDISYFVYSTCSEEELSHFDALLDTYYHSFSSFLDKFGCDSTIIFPYSVMEEHWKKYSLYGFVMSITFLNLLFCEDEDATNCYEDIHCFQKQTMNSNAEDNHEYQKRLATIVTHYTKYIS